MACKKAERKQRATLRPDPDAPNARTAHLVDLRLVHILHALHLGLVHLVLRVEVVDHLGQLRNLLGHLVVQVGEGAADTAAAATVASRLLLLLMRHDVSQRYGWYGFADSREKRTDAGGKTDVVN